MSAVTPTPIIPPRGRLLRLSRGEVQHAVLEYLLGQTVNALGWTREIRTSDIARATGHAASSVRGAVKGLKARGLVREERQRRDGWRYRYMVEREAGL